MTRLAIFDCDGTLVDGQADVLWSMKRAFERADLPAPDPAVIRRKVGLSLGVAVRDLAPGVSRARHRDIAEYYRSSFRARREEGLSHEPLYDGIADLLHHLRDSGWTLAVATGKSRRGLVACLVEHEIDDLFASLQTADDHPSKPHPAMLHAVLADADTCAGHAVMIGDTTYDIDMAARARLRAIGVAWGYHEPAELIEHGAVMVASDIAELQAEFDRLASDWA